MYLDDIVIIPKPEISSSLFSGAESSRDLSVEYVAGAVTTDKESHSICGAYLARYIVRHFNSLASFGGLELGPFYLYAPTPYTKPPPSPTTPPPTSTPTTSPEFPRPRHFGPTPGLCGGRLRPRGRTRAVRSNCRADAQGGPRRGDRQARRGASHGGALARRQHVALPSA